MTVTPASVPRLAPHTRLRFDAVRNNWTIQAPERVFVLDAVAHAVVSRCDGTADMNAIVEALCARYDRSSHDAIERDVLAMVEDLVGKKALIL